MEYFITDTGETAQDLQYVDDEEVTPGKMAKKTRKTKTKEAVKAKKAAEAIQEAEDNCDKICWHQFVPTTTKTEKTRYRPTITYQKTWPENK